MPRHLDIAALRAFAIVADVGGVTRAAGHLNLTQSAVSMQIKRLETALGVPLFDRTQRRMMLTPAGEQLQTYAGRILSLNDEALARLTDDAYEGEITLGVPHDIIYPAIPHVLSAFAQRFPRLRVHLLSLPTRRLKEMFADGDCDLIVTTEATPGAAGESLVTLPLVWAGATGGSAWRARPLRFAFCRNCIFAPIARERLDAAGIPFESAVDSASDRASEAAVQADLAVYAILSTMMPQGIARLPPSVLPPLPDQDIVLYRSRTLIRELSDVMADLLRESYARLGAPLNEGGLGHGHDDLSGGLPGPQMRHRGIDLREGDHLRDMGG